MDRRQVELRDFSLRLSHVLDDIGLNERTVILRRRTGLLKESHSTLVEYVIRNGIATIFRFGSQTEGTTSIGLDSDEDNLLCFNIYNVIQDWSQWEQGKLNVLMVRDNVAPGYCRLQVLRSDTPVAREDVLTNYEEYDDEGRVLMKNTMFNSYPIPGLIRHGPSLSSEEVNADYVCGLPCKSWPTEALPWITRVIASQWPGRNLRRFALNSGCFVVPTGHCLSDTERLEWRKSTSIAERCLMFNMNITQIRCYVVLKMIMKTFLNGIVTSYQCKTVLMYLVEITDPELWKGECLIFCIIKCLWLLQICLLSNNCPHYFIPENNLMGGRLDLETRQYVARVIGNIIDSNCIAVLCIKMDDVGDRLYAACNPFYRSDIFMSPNDVRLYLYRRVHLGLYIHTHKKFQAIANNVDNHTHITNCFNMKDDIRRVLKFHKNGSCSERAAADMLAPLLCSTLGAMLASDEISRGRCISAESLQWLSSGIDSDVASGRLKLASALYCSGSITKASVILTDVEQRYENRVTEPICGCASIDYSVYVNNLRFSDNCFLYYDNKTVLNINVAFGVVFTRKEKHCAPKGLQCEMFKCTEEERRARDDEYNNNTWMDFAVVDALPYLYYLQYLTYRRQDNRSGQQRSLGRLKYAINTEPNLGHRETALNLLGQCMEDEGRLADAFTCYRRSLDMKPTHNVARWHIAILLYRLM